MNSTRKKAMTTTAKTITKITATTNTATASKYNM
jgi:hypothetical protein